VKIGDKEVDVSTEFRLYLTTKLPNPDYTPEISTKAMIVNFAVKMSGLEAQLLDTVVKHERPDLAKQKSDLVVKVRGVCRQCTGLNCAAAALSHRLAIH
jgi:dynein heavy chain